MTINSKHFRVQEGEDVSLRKWPTTIDPICNSQEQYKTLLDEHVAQLSAMQQLHSATNNHAILLIFQAMDAAGKDGAIRHVMSGVNPQVARYSVSRLPARRKNARLIVSRVVLDTAKG